MPEHVHSWQLVMALDGCHTYTNTYRCVCGVTTQISGERQMLDRGRPTYSMMMADDECERCSQLCMGARRKPGTRHVLLSGGEWRKVKLHA